MTTLRAGLSGCGATGLAAVQRTRLHGHCDIVAVHDPDPAAVRAVRERTGVGFGTTSFAELLGTGVDFVVFAGPAGRRVDLVRSAAEQMVHCLLHAPIATSLADAASMVEACDAAAVKLGVAVEGQDDPILEQVRRMIAADWFGGLVGVQGMWGEDDLLRLPPAPGDWRLEPGLVGDDPLLRLLTQHVHLTAWLCGRTALRVTAQRTGGFLPLPHDGAVATAVLRGNVLCTFAVSHLTNARMFAIHGTDGGVRLHGDHVSVLGRTPFHGDVFDYLDPDTETVFHRCDLAPAIAKQRGAHELHGRFARWIDDLDDFPCPGEQALADLRIVQAMRRAADTEAAQSP